MQIRFFGIFIDFMDLHELKMELKENTTLEDLISSLDERSNGKFKKMIINQRTGKFSDQVMVVLNGKDITRLEGLDIQIKNGDKLLFYQASAGG